MELKWLDDFVCLVKAGSFSRASAERNVTQPAFSRRIRALEDWLGVTLIDRSSYPVSLTPHGTQFLPHAQEILRTSFSIREDFRLITKAQANTVKIVALHTLSLYFLPELIGRMLKMHEDVKAEVIPSIQGVDQHFEALENGVADILVTYGDNTFDGQWAGAPRFDEKIVAQDRMLPVTSAEFARVHGISDIRTAQHPIPLLNYSSFSFSDRLVAPVVEKLGSRLRLVYENGLSESLKAVVMMDAGLAWLPEISIRDELSSGALVCAGDEELMIDLTIKAYRDKDNAGDIADAMWQLL